MNYCKVSIEEAWEWLDVEYESNQIKKSNWVFLEDKDKNEILSSFV